MIRTSCSGVTSREFWNFRSCCSFLKLQFFDKFILQLRKLRFRRKSNDSIPYREFECGSPRQSPGNKWRKCAQHVFVKKVLFHTALQAHSYVLRFAEEIHFYGDKTLFILYVPTKIFRTQQTLERNTHRMPTPVATDRQRCKHNFLVLMFWTKWEMDSSAFCNFALWNTIPL